METVVPETHLPIELRDLSGPVTVQMPGVAAWLEKQQGERFTVRLENDRLETNAEGFRAGTLVELITPERYYLGEVSYRDGNRLEITAEHELDRVAVSAIQAAWGSAPRAGKLNRSLASE